MPNPTVKERAKPKRKLSKRRVILLSILACLFIVLGITAGVVASIVAKTPPFDPATLTNTQQSSIIYDKDGNQIGVIHAKENREVVQSKDIKDSIKQAFVTVEDIRFYKHHGVDLYGIARAAFSDLKGGKLQGASTITIQLARNAFLTPEQTLTRKIQEAFLAMKLERLYTKDEILTMYLNRIPFGESAYGIKAAAQTYFGISDLNKLDTAQIALLAGLPQAPSGYDPYVHPNAAKQRRAIVLGVLRDHGVISQAEYDKAKNEPFSYVDKMKKENKNPASVNNSLIVSYKFPYFVDYVIHDLESNYGINEDAIYSGGLKIYTTVDSKVQAAAEKAFADPKNFPPNRGGSEVEGAMVMMDPQTGSIRAMVGGRHYTTALSFNRAWQAQRQPGSSIKPLAVYAPALAKGGYFPGTVLDDMPVSYTGADGTKWSPVDDDTADGRGWRGLMNMRDALRQSVNVYAIKLLDKIGIDYGWQFAKDKFGLQLDDKAKVLSLALGTPEQTVLDMVSAYSAFPNGGELAQKHSVVKVIDSKGNTLIDNTNVPKKRIFSEQVAYLISDMLHGVVTSGTGTNAQIPGWFVAGKTGTTSLDNNNNIPGSRDAWWMGYTPNYVGGVWMGFDNTTLSRNMQGNYGGNKPALLWKKVMETALQGKPAIAKIPNPGGLSYITYDAKSGLTPSSLTPPQFIKHDYAIQGALPKGTSNVWVRMDVCADTGLLPGPNTKTTVSKVFLNVKRAPNAPWPSSELPYKPPTKVCNMGPGSGSATTQPSISTTAPPSPGSTLANLSKVSALYNVKTNKLTVTFALDNPAKIQFSVNGSTPILSPDGFPPGLDSLTIPLDNFPPSSSYTVTLAPVDPSDPQNIGPPLTVNAQLVKK